MCRRMRLFLSPVALIHCQETEPQPVDNETKGEAGEGDQGYEEESRPKKPNVRMRRGAVSAAVISEAEATSYVKKVSKSALVHVRERANLSDGVLVNLSVSCGRGIYAKIGYIFR